MKSRRYFLMQGALATTAMLVVKPFTSVARTVSSFTGFSGSYGQLVFLHTANLNSSSDYDAIQYIKDIKNSKANTILLKTGQNVEDETCQLTYDVSFNEKNDLSAITGDYKIIHKGNVTTGIISAKPGDADVIQKINTLSAYLKNEKNCTVVVCLSQLGYKNKKAPDDIMLADKSTHLDIIIGGHPDNFHIHPIIALNHNNAEVIIHSAAGDPTTLGKIAIDFNDQGQKKHISFINELSTKTVPDRAMPAA